MPDAAGDASRARLYRDCARISRAILRAESADLAYGAACGLALDTGLCELAWVAERDAVGGSLRPVARSGGPDALVDRFCHGYDPAETASPVARALSQARAVVSNELARDEQSPQRDLAIAAGLRSIACLPLVDDDREIGVLVLCSTQPERFDEALVGLLHEIAADLTYVVAQRLEEQVRGSAAMTRAHFLAYYSPQTGLPNRARLEQHVQDLARSQDTRFALLSIRLQRTDAISRVFGSSALDDTMGALARRLERDCEGRGGDCIAAQVSHDEFAVAVPRPGDRAEVEAFAHRLTLSLSRPLPAPDDSQVVVATRIGAVAFPEDERQPDRLLGRARAAAAKASPNGAPAWYEGRDEDSAAHLSLEAELHRALELGEFELEYQPQANLATGAIVGVEALLRWRNPKRGLLKPDSFMAALERTGLMGPVGSWVLRTACLQSRAWSDAGLPAVRMAVNVCAEQLRDGTLAQTVREILRSTGVDGPSLELEVTENLVVDDAGPVVWVMHELRKLGVEISLDDFGTGHSSLSYLSRLPIDRVKVDKSFVCGIASDPDSAMLVRAILSMASSLGLATVAEGVEHEAQLGYLRRHGCTEMQGHLFSASLPPAEIAAMLERDRRLAIPHDRSPSGSTVLVVDDEPGVQSALRRALRRDGITVLVAETAREGFEILAASDVGVILCDQRMPVMTGAEFLEAVKRLHPDSIRILLTGYTEVSTLIDAVNRGAVSKVLTKPWEDDHLRAHVAEALRHYEAMRESRLFARGAKSAPRRAEAP